jgi:type III secretion protein J
MLLAGCSVEIIHELKEGEANEILTALYRRGITAQKKRLAEGGTASYAVTVGRDEAIQAWQVLRQESLPRPKRRGLGEVFGNSGLIPTATQQRALMHHALAGELSETLQSVEGVLEARVHVVLPERNPLAPPDAERTRPKASVLLRTRGKATIREAEVKALVAGGVTGLEPDQVSVVMIAAVQQEKRQKIDVAARLVHVGPFAVAAGSRGALLTTLITGLALLVALGSATLVLLRRSRALASQPRERAPQGSLRAERLESSLSLLERSLSGSPGSATSARARATGEGKDSY